MRDQFHRGMFLLLASLSDCAQSTPRADAMADLALDASILGTDQVSPPACNEHFMAATLSFSEEAEQPFCVPLGNGAQQIYRSSMPQSGLVCDPVLTEVTGSLLEGVTVNLGSPGSLFSSSGERSVFLALVGGAGRSFCGDPQHDCRWIACEETCRFRVTASGGVGARVGGELIEACALCDENHPRSPHYRLMLRAMRVLGPLTSGRVLASSDSGLDATCP